LQRALQENNPQLCLDASEYYPDDEIVQCISTIAVREQNRTICEELLIDREEDYCLNDIFVAKGNISACQTVSRYERCYSEILATQEYPEQACASFEGRPFAQCYKQLQCDKSKDSVSCKQLVWDAERDTDLCQYEDHEVAVKKCFNRIAVLINKPDLCFQGIWDECFESFASATGNISYCKRAGERSTPCFRSFNSAAIIQYKQQHSITDIEACLPHMDWDREDCYFKQAQQQENASYCENVGGVKEACYEELALKLNDPTLCQGNKCYRILAGKLERPTLCQNITSIEQRYWCYKDLALKLNNPALCNNAAHDIKDMCFFEYVQATGNHNLCHQIESESRKEACFNL